MRPGGIHIAYILGRKDSYLLMFSANKLKEQLKFQVRVKSFLWSGLGCSLASHCQKSMSRSHSTVEYLLTYANFLVNSTQCLSTNTFTCLFEEQMTRNFDSCRSVGLNNEKSQGSRGLQNFLFWSHSTIEYLLTYANFLVISTQCFSTNTFTGLFEEEITQNFDSCRSVQLK